MRQYRSRLAGLCMGVALATTAFGSPVLAKDLFTVDLVDEPSSLDPQGQWNPDSYYVYRNIFDNLVTRDNDGKIVPEVAKSWEQLSDTETKFVLRDDIKFQDGTPLTAEDVVFSVKRIIDPKFGSPQLGQFNTITDAKKTGDHEVVLTTAGIYPVLLPQLVKLSIVPQHVVEKVGNDEFNLHPVGSGPYTFDSWQRGVSVTLKKNDAYWGPKGPFETVVFRTVPDSSTRLADLQAGAADLVVSLNSDQTTQLESATGVKPVIVQTERIGYLGLNTAVPPFNDPKMRMAVSYAIDKEGLVEGILGAGQSVLGEMLAPVSFGYVDGIKPDAYDPEKAKQLIAEAGGAKGKIVFDTSPVFDQRVVQAIQQMLNDVGFSVDLNLMDLATYLKKVRDPSIEARSTISFGRWSCACQDADGTLYPLLQSQSSWSRYQNADMDKLLEEARSSLDPAVRLKAYSAVHKIVKDEAILIPLYQSAAIYGAKDGLQWTPTANESLFLNRMNWQGE